MKKFTIFLAFLMIFLSLSSLVGAEVYEEWETPHVQCVLPTKVWAIKFNKKIDRDSVSMSKVFVKDSSGDIFPTSLSMRNEVEETIPGD